MRESMIEIGAAASVFSDFQLALAHRPRPSKHRGARDFEWPMSKRGNDRRQARVDHILNVRTQQASGMERRNGPLGSEAAAAFSGIDAVRRREAAKTALAASKTKRLTPAAAPKTEPRR